MTIVAQPLARHQWQDRILLLFGPDQSAAMLQEQLAALQDLSADLEDRNLLIYKISPKEVFGPKDKLDAETAHWFYEKYRVNEAQFCLILIGKDGGEKLRKKTLTPPKDIFALIDSMPMRRSEMNRKRKLE